MAIFIVSLAFNLLGDGLRDVLDPKGVPNDSASVGQEPARQLPDPHRHIRAVRGVSFDLGRERLGVVGESGSGKSMTGRAILGLVRPPGRVTADRLDLDGQPILNLPARQMRALRARASAWSCRTRNSA